MKYTREDFVSLMAKMEDKYRMAERVANTIDNMMGDTWSGTNFLEHTGFNWYMDYLVQTLEKMYAEELEAIGEPELLSLFIYEGDFGKDKRDAAFETAGDLYDYLMTKGK